MIAVELPPFVHIQVYDATAGLLTVLVGVPRGWGSDWQDFAWG